MRLHLGCGRRHLEGWVNIDNRPDVGADVVAEVGALPYDDNSASIIYACHVLEHVPRPDVLPVLREWRRVLRPGGMLYVAVPDFKALASLYLEDNTPLWRIIGPVMGRQDYPGNTHRVVFDYDYLAWHLTEAGFHSVCELAGGMGWEKDWDDYSWAEIDEVPISLNVRATA
jgi:predicted SAM-dependent methyltransferase